MKEIDLKIETKTKTNKMEKCASCKREFEKVDIQSGIGPCSFFICEECHENHCFPIEMIEGEVRSYQNPKGGRVKEFRERATVYEKDEYVNLEKWLCLNEERLVEKYLTMEKEELLENIINGNMSMTNPVTIFDGEIIYVNKEEFSAIFSKVNENNWANKEKEKCNTIIVGRFIISKINNKTITIGDMNDFEKRLENPIEYDEIVKQHNLDIKVDELAQNIIHKTYNKQFSNQDKKYIVFIYEEDENLKHTDILCIDINEPFEIPNIKNAIAAIHSTFLENYEFTVFDEDLAENFLYPYNFRIYITGIDKHGKFNSIHKDF